jgi:hypothetical protein
VRIVAPLDVCLDRVRQRSSKNHIPVSDEMVAVYNHVASQVSLPWDLQIENEPPLSEKMIIDAMKSIQLPAAEL